MSYRLRYTRTFEKQIEKLQEAPDSGKALKYELDPYRAVRVKGKYRLVYKVNEEEKEIILVAFGHRKEIYKFMMLLREE